MNKKPMSREEAIEDLKTFLDYYEEGCGVTPMCFEYAIKVLETTPDIVRCKECKYWDRYQDRFCGHIAEYTNADDFCSYGKPKEISTDCAWK